MLDTGQTFNAAISALNNGDLKRAEELFRSVIKIDESHIAALNLLVAVLMSMQRFSEAEPLIARATLLNRQSDVSFYNYGLISKYLNKPQQALENFSKAIGLNQNVAETWNNRGTTFNDLSEYELAIADFDKAIQINSQYGEAYANKGKSLTQLKRYDEASAAYDKALSIKPDLAEAWLGRGNAFWNLQRYDEASAAYDKALSIKPNLAGAWVGRGNAFWTLQRYDEAFAAYDKALSIKPDLAEAWRGRGNLFLTLKRYDEASAAYDKALSIKPDLVEAWLGRGNAFWNLRRYDEAFAAYDKALSIKAESEGAWLGRGNLFWTLKRYDEAFAAYDKALSIKPDLAEAWLGRGNVFWNLRRYDEASAAYDKALSLKPELEGAWLGRGNLFWTLKRYDEAFAAYDKALSIKPDLAEGWLGRGNVFWNLQRHDEAFAAYDKALSIKPNLAEAWRGRGNVFDKLRRHDEAFVSYDKALSIEPDLASVEGARLHAKMQLCDWSNFDVECAHLDASIRAGIRTVPFGVLALSTSAHIQLQCASVFSRLEYPASSNALSRGERYGHQRIRVAYLSGDFGDHPVSLLMAGVFEQHNRELFETIAISYRPIESTGVSRRLKNSFEQFIDVNDRSDAEVAKLIRELEIDIAVDLMGYTTNARPAILMHRPAPVQVNYLGYPGTMGAEYIDYIIADRWVIPEEHRQFYAEKVIYLPNTFQANDSERKISDLSPSRAAAGLPDGGFVFCAFNNSYKITPSIFDVWMRLLQRVPGSVLWLLGDNATVKGNLRREAECRGVDAGRLMFAPRIRYADYLARYQLADLFLDTLPFNAGTTGSDALWAGLPLVTFSGEAFASRMAGSLLKALGMPELITASIADYEALAVDLASDPELMASTRVKLARNRLSEPLFDTELFTRHLEEAYTKIYERHRASLPPDHLCVEE